MGRILGVPLVIVALAGAVYFGSQQIRQREPGAPAIVEDTARAESAAAAANLATAATALQSWFAANGTYAGALLPDGSGVVLVRGDATGYCAQTDPTRTSAVEHEAGPNGVPQPGPC